MRKRHVLAWLLCAALLCGCQGKPEETAAAIVDPIPQEALSQDLREALEAEWASWNALSEERQILSSHVPGWCQRGFEDWTACEDFLGFSVSNPLENCEWLEKGTYVAMPLGFMDAPRVDLQWDGTEEGYVDWANASAGYRAGETRVTVSALLYGDPAKAKFSDGNWTLDLGKQDVPADGVLHVISENTERYCFRKAYLIRGGVLYDVHVVGEPDGKAEVEETLERALEAFPEDPA